MNELQSLLPTADISAQKAHIETLSETLGKVYLAHAALDRLEDKATKIANTEEAAMVYQGEVNEAMENLRELVDSLEVITAREYWPVPTYGDMTYGI